MPKAPRSIPKRRRHKKWLKRAKGYVGRRSTVFKLAKEAVITAGQHAYNDRRTKKTKRRALWHIQINGAARQVGTTYSKLMRALKDNQSELDRKVLAELATKHPQSFSKLVEKVTSTKS